MLVHYGVRVVEISIVIQPTIIIGEKRGQCVRIRAVLLITFVFNKLRISGDVCVDVGDIYNFRVIIIFRIFEVFL